VTLTLVVDGSTGSGVPDGAGAASSVPGGASASTAGGTSAGSSAASGSSVASASRSSIETDDEIFDPDDVVDAVPVESVAEARVLEAFPGAEEV
jgi:hypothetical protein